MASSENQGLQIALVIFIVLTLILSVTTYLFFSQYNEHREKARQMSDKANSAQTQARATQDEINAIKQMVGLPDSATLDEVRTAFNEDMQQHAAGIPAEEQHYRPVLVALANAKLATEQLLAEEQAKVERLKTDLAAVETAAGAQINEHKGAVQTAQTDKTTEINRLSGIQKDVESAKKEALATFDKSKAEALAKFRESQDQYATLEAEKNNLVAKVDDLILELKRHDITEFDRPDGEIVRVDPGARTVWINVGRADNLPRQTTFSVHSADNHKLDSRKAVVEVTRVMLDHLAEARIIEGSDVDPIIAGDHIFSPAWKKGREVHFAVAGWMDIDSDGRDDRPLVEQLIRTAGGVIDADDRNLGPEGKPTGTVNINTRYLVLGTEPKADARGAGGADIDSRLKAYRAVVDQANEYRVETINLDEFLDLVGFSAPQRVLTFDGATPGGKFQPDAPDGGRRVSQPTVEDIFRRRRPPNGNQAPAVDEAAAAGRTSAY